MIAIPTDTTDNPAAWQSQFLGLLPGIEQNLRQVFAGRDPATLEDAVVDGVYLCMLSFKALHQRGRGGCITGTSLAWFAAKQIRSGRGAECHLNSHEPLSRYAQRRHQLRRTQLFEGDAQNREWIDALVSSCRASILDQVATRMDFVAWLTTLCERSRQIATQLGQGYSTSEVAGKFGVTAGRISQVRSELAKSWKLFQGERDMDVFQASA